jgi:CheY-like chemotaxis protein
VDDDSLVRGSLAAVLVSEGYLVDEARNGIEAVSRAIEHSPDLVLLDLNMPHWDGWTAFSQLDRVTPLLPVVVITARPNQYEKAVRLGVDAFMEKPLNIPVLVRAIKRLTSEDEKRHDRRITNPRSSRNCLTAPIPDRQPPATPFSGDKRWTSPKPVDIGESRQTLEEHIRR